MAQQVTVTARGLFLGQNDLGAVPEGALAQADNCAISKDGIVETRRGLANLTAKAMERYFPFKGYVVGWAASVLSRSTDNGATWADYSGSYAKPGSPVHAAEGNGNLYFTSSSGIQRLDSFTGTPEPAGMPGGLDVQASVGAAGTAIPPNNQVAYRIIWGKRDANGNLIVGAPSGRSVAVNPAPYQIAIGSLVRAGSTVTATLAAGATQVFRAGESVTLSTGETNFVAGVKTIATVSPTQFTYTEAGSATSSTAVQTFTGPYRDVTVTASVPQGLPSGSFFQAYRSANSTSDALGPDDNLGLVYEGAAPVAASVTQLSRTSGVVTATTAAPHGYVTGQLVRVSPGGSIAGAVMALGSLTAAQRSTDNGATWSGAGITDLSSYVFAAGTFTGSVAVAVGQAGYARSTDGGLTWLVAGGPYNDQRAVAYGGGRLVSVGQSGHSSYSTNGGVSWSAGGTIGAFSINCSAVIYDGSQFVAVADAGGFFTSPDGAAWSSAGGVGYVGTTLYGLAYTGLRYIAVGQNGGNAVIYYAASPSGPWTQAVSVAGGSFNAVAYSGTAVIAIGSNGNVYYSTDGVSWNSVALAGTFSAITWNGAAFVAVGTNVAATATAAGATWTTRTIASGTYTAAISVSGTIFSASEFVVTGAPSGTTFTYADAGTDAVLVQAQIATPLTALFTDSIPSGFIGAALYTNPNEGTITAAANRVALCQDLVAFRGFMFAANVTYPSHASVYLLSVGGTGGIAAGDTITIDGLAYTAHATTESISGRTFIAYTNGTPSQNIANTVASLIRIINRTLSSSITATYLSGANDVPGLVYFEENGAAATMTLAFSKPTAWSVQSLKGPENRKNELRWSSQQQPDAWPLTNTSPIGSLDKQIDRIVVTRDMLLVVKPDGFWRLTGYGGVWDIQQLDPTMGTPAPETLVAFENAVFGVCDSGVMRITESGVESITAPIYPALEPLLATAALPTLRSVAFGIAYHSAHKYLLWLPLAAGDTVAKQAYVYDSWTQAWTRWLPPTGTSGFECGIVNPADDRLLYADGTNVWRESKLMSDADLADGSPPSPIPVVVKFTPRFGGNPGQLHHFQEVALIFRRVRFGSLTASVSFSTNVSPNEETITLSGADYGVDAAVGTQTTIRVLVPLEKARASQLNVKVSHAEAGSPFQLQGLSVVFRPGSNRVGR